MAADLVYFLVRERQSEVASGVEDLGRRLAPFEARFLAMAVPIPGGGVREGLEKIWLCGRKDEEPLEPPVTVASLPERGLVITSDRSVGGNRCDF